MLQLRLRLIPFAVLVAFALRMNAQAVEKHAGAICGNPGFSGACSPAASHNLPFVFPNDGLARDEFKSDPFYAILLKSAEPCTITDDELHWMQKLYHKNKVFASRFGCQDEEVIRYTNVNEKFGFAAVYAGDTLADAKKLLQVVQASKAFPGANIRKMQAVLVYP
jgi:hypothetical protein